MPIPLPLFRAATLVLGLQLLGTCSLLAQASQPASPGQPIQGVVHREGDERYRLTFPVSGGAFVEVSGAPADCSFQVGSQGFQDSDSSPVDWTDGQPGQTIRHAFRVEAGRPGTIWVLLRSRLAAVGGNNWSAVACSAGGPFYVTPDRATPAGRAPASFEGRPVQPPIRFRVVAQLEGASLPRAERGNASPQPGGSPEDAIVAEYRSLLPAVLKAERKPWHTRFEFVANAVKAGAGYRVAYKTYCVIDKGPDAGKDYACFEFDSVLDLGAMKAAVADMKRRLGR